MIHDPDYSHIDDKALGFELFDANDLQLKI
jgi:hypothetical protein